MHRTPFGSGCKLFSEESLRKSELSARTQASLGGLIAPPDYSFWSHPKSSSRCDSGAYQIESKSIKVNARCLARFITMKGQPKSRVNCWLIQNAHPVQTNLKEIKLNCVLWCSAIKGRPLSAIRGALWLEEIEQLRLQFGAHAFRKVHLKTCDFGSYTLFGGAFGAGCSLPSRVDQR